MITYEEFEESIKLAESMSTGKLVFTVFLFIGIAAGIVFFALFLRKEYRRKLASMDSFLLDEHKKPDIVIPGVTDKEEPKKEGFLGGIFNSFNKE